MKARVIVLLSVLVLVLVGVAAAQPQAAQAPGHPDLRFAAYLAAAPVPASPAEGQILPGVGTPEPTPACDLCGDGFCTVDDETACAAHCAPCGSILACHFFNCTANCKCIC